MAKIDQGYHNLLGEVLSKGYTYEDPNRKGINRIQIPSYTFYHSFSDGFPALTTKEVYFKGAVGELLVFLLGNTELKILHDKKIRFWDKDAYNFYLKRNPEGNKKQFEEGINNTNHIAGDLGKIYPYQMRNWGGQYDQINNLIETLISNPMATKKTVTMWNPLDLEHSCLSPCHWSFEILTRPSTRDEKIVNPGIYHRFTLKWHQHSVDTFLGFPINIMYYSLMAYIIGKITNMIPEGIIGDLSNVHIYEPHLDAVKKQLNNKTDKYNNCTLQLNKTSELILKSDKSLDDKLNSLKIEDFKLSEYESYPSIKADMLTYSK